MTPGNKFIMQLMSVVFMPCGVQDHDLCYVGKEFLRIPSFVTCCSQRRAV